MFDNDGLTPELKTKILNAFRQMTIVVDELSQSGELLNDEQLEDMLEVNDVFTQIENL